MAEPLDTREQAAKEAGVSHGSLAAFRYLKDNAEPEELAQLEANLLADGCRDPLVLWNGTLLDGHNRFDICQRHKLEFKTTAITLPDEDAAMVWIIRNQFVK